MFLIFLYYYDVNKIEIINYIDNSILFGNEVFFF